MARKTQQVEERLVAEYLKDVYPQYPTINKQPLGKVSESLMATEGYKRALGISRPFRPYADAIVILPGALVLIEAKVWSILNGLAKLPMYKSLVPFTPELKDYWKLPVVMELVVGWSNTNLEIMARKYDVKVVVYCPDWLKTVVERMHNYWTKEYREERERVMENRRMLGVE